LSKNIATKGTIQRAILNNGQIAKHQFFDTTNPKIDKNSPFYFFQTLSIKITA